MKLKQSTFFGVLAIVYAFSLAVCLWANVAYGADVKISALPAASALDGTEVAPVVQSSTTKKATIDQIKTWTSNSPTLVTPVLGVATATSVNKVTITAPASSAVLTIPDGVTLTGPASSGTAMTLGNAETVTGAKTFGSAGAVGKLKIAGTTSGSTILDATAAASGTLTLPALTDTLAVKGTDNSFTAGQTITPAVGASGLTIAAATQTSSFPAISVVQTWNNSGTTFTGKLTNITSTASAAASLIEDWQVGGVSQMSISKSGALVVAGSIAASTAVTGSGFKVNGKTLYTSTAPTIASGLCTSPSVSANNGSAAFALTVGTSCSGVQTGTLTMPAATTGYACAFQNVTNPASSTIGQTGGSTTSVTFTNYARTTGLAADFTASDSIRVMCLAY